LGEASMAKILVVDDSDDFRASIVKLLTRFGCVVKDVANGRDALASVLADTPDLILTDVQMPELDGPSLLEVLRSYLRLHSLPVVVMTGVDEGPLIDRIRAQKVNSILIKGKASLEDIEAAVKEALVTLPTCLKLPVANC
jgi:CheY-like chemotaxis protein